MKLPFLYRLPEGPESGVMVVIAKQYDWRGSDDEWVREGVLEPAVDLHEETHCFHTEKEALKFVQQWWQDQDL